MQNWDGVWRCIVRGTSHCWVSTPGVAAPAANHAIATRGPFHDVWLQSVAELGGAPSLVAVLWVVRDTRTLAAYLRHWR